MWACKIKLKTKICLNHVACAIIIWISIRADIVCPCFGITDSNPGESDPLDCDLYHRMPTNEMLCALCTRLNINFAVNWCYVGQCTCVSVCIKNILLFPLYCTPCHFSNLYSSNCFLGVDPSTNYDLLRSFVRISLHKDCYYNNRC